MKKKKNNNKRTVIILLILALVIAAVPLFILKGATFGGSDDAGSQMVSQITGGNYKPWFTPVLEKWIGGQIPGEVETLLFCLQTAIGTGIIFFFIGRFYERNKMAKARLSEKEKEKAKDDNSR